MNLTIAQINAMYEKTRGFDQRATVSLRETDQPTVVLLQVYNVKTFIGQFGAWDSYSSESDELIASSSPRRR